MNSSVVRGAWLPNDGDYRINTVPGTAVECILVLQVPSPRDRRLLLPRDSEHDSTASTKT